MATAAHVGHSAEWRRDARAGKLAAMTISTDKPIYLLGVDGGGTGTRVVLATSDGVELSRAESGPSGLGLGIDHAWKSIRSACAHAFDQAGLSFDWSVCALGCGLAGVNHSGWLQQFHAAAPAVRSLTVESDALTALLGAHGGAPGVIVALGTGSIGAVLDSSGQVALAGGYGFPSGDEASGAWLGLHAVVHLQRVMDGRSPADAFSQALLARTGVGDRDGLVVWLSGANQTAYATLAPTLFEHRDHPFSASLLADAGNEIGLMVTALDPAGALPVALCGGLGVPLERYVTGAVRDRLCKPKADSAAGALQLARRGLDRLASSEG